MPKSCRQGVVRSLADIVALESWSCRDSTIAFLEWLFNRHGMYKRTSLHLCQQFGDLGDGRVEG